MKMFYIALTLVFSSVAFAGADDTNSLGGLFKKLIDKAAQAQSAQPPADAYAAERAAASAQAQAEGDAFRARMRAEEEAATAERTAKAAAEKQAIAVRQAKEDAEAEQEAQQKRLANCNDLRNHTGQYAPTPAPSAAEEAKEQLKLINHEMADLMANHGLDEATAREMATNKVAGIQLQLKEYADQIDEQMAQIRQRMRAECQKEFGS
jgi:ribosome recycling factor